MDALTLYLLQRLSQGVASPDAPKKLYQALLPSAAATIYTVPTSLQTRYESARFYNSDTVARTVTLYDGGTAAGNTILPATTIPAGDWIELDLSGMGQQAAGTIAAVASAASVVAMTLHGSEEDMGQKLYKKLYQGTPGASWASILTLAARTRISHIRAVNTHASAVEGLGLAQNGSSAVNILQESTSSSSQIVAGGVMEIQSYFAFAASDVLWGKSGADIVLTAYGIEG